jgi:hypothetical protein
MLLAPLLLSHSITSRKVGVAHFSMLSVLVRANTILAQVEKKCKVTVKGIIMGDQRKQKSGLAKGPIGR